MWSNLWELYQISQDAHFWAFLSTLATEPTDVATCDFPVRTTSKSFLNRHLRRFGITTAALHFENVKILLSRIKFLVRLELIVKNSYLIYQTIGHDGFVATLYTYNFVFASFMWTQLRVENLDDGSTISTVISFKKTFKARIIASGSD